MIAAAAEIVELNLADTALDDAGLAAIGALPAATHLRLARNELTDAGLASLAALPQLAYLNLYGNSGITDAGVEMLAAIATLRELYLWQTGVSAKASRSCGAAPGARRRLRRGADGRRTLSCTAGAPSAAAAKTSEPTAAARIASAHPRDEIVVVVTEVGGASAS